MRNEIPKTEGVLPHIIPSTWAFKIKRYPDGRLRTFKGRFCVRGDRQIEGVDYFETHTPVASWSSIRMILVMALQQDWSIKQVDFSNAFVQATLDKDVCVAMPPLFQDNTSPFEQCLKLKKSLCGMVDSPRHWWMHVQQGLIDLSFKAK